MSARLPALPSDATYQIAIVDRSPDHASLCRMSAKASHTRNDRVGDLIPGLLLTQCLKPDKRAVVPVRRVIDMAKPEHIWVGREQSEQVCFLTEVTASSVAASGRSSKGSMSVTVCYPAFPGLIFTSVSETTGTPGSAVGPARGCLWRPRRKR